MKKCFPLAAFTSAILLSTGSAYASSSQLINQHPAIEQQTFLVGSWTGEATGPRTQKAFFPSKGIYTVRLSADGGMMPVAVTPADSPSWITVDDKQQFAYVLSEVDDGKISTYRLKKNGELALVNIVDSGGMHPTHATLSPDGRALLVANYSAKDGKAGLSVLPIDAKGKLGELSQFFPYLTGSQAVSDRQNSGHAHSATFSPDGNYLLTADLGADKIYVYHYQTGQKKPLTLDSDKTISFASGSGPRHCTFSVDGKFLYVTTEMSAEVQVFSFEQGMAKLIQQQKLTDSTDANDKSGAGLSFSPDGRFLYVGNRGNKNQIVVWSADKQTGKLSNPMFYSAGGIEPREFSFDNSGHYLFVANVYSNNVVEFARDSQTGALTPTGATLQIGTPTQVKFLTGSK